MSDKPIRVLIVDDQRLMRDGIASLLSLQNGIEVIGTASNGQKGVEYALALTPDVILMDIRMPVMDGVETTRQVRASLPDCQVLALTTFDDEEYVVAILRAGACGYLLKDIPAPDLAQAIHAAHKGIYQLDPSVAGKILTTLMKGKRSDHIHLGPEEEGAASPDLTAREVEVLRLLAGGATNREIGEQLVITEGTVKNHISNILSRLGLRDRTQAALYAREHGLL